ncbi:NAD(P)H-dependent flavin oxidoreductase [Priestia taiwanensis]|uniref:Probable nitronate monooxygenase n=1 Tax=Priestia taiwanensis TaxID=1347902 RepID=A0A917ETS5_9BACI|nr:nitronate monooxygenase family protein [Priestia taiwanensis]MBM7364496.1 nitronate monooxygenase [Priestia taiwanensis]GGE81038.1 nitronate monooxygenase [Priestia taiwanensis]
MKIFTPLCTKLGITYPIIQAGMAGGPTTAKLVAHVSEAGALGTLGAAYMSPDQLRQATKEIKQQTSKPFAVNLFCTNMEDNTKGIERVQPILNRFREKLGISDGNLQIHTQQWFEEQFQIVIEEAVPIISTAFGVLPPYTMKLAKERGITVTTMVTTIEEAIYAEEQGTDIIVAQGSDAGGHRSTFDMTKHPNGANIGTFSLVPQIVDHVSVPVIAAGGIMDGRGLVAALALGAQGVQMGTAFLPSVESGAHAKYKEALLQSTEESTVITKSFSGRPARGIKNEFIRQFEFAGIAPLAFPSQNTITSDIRKAASLQNDANYMSLWAGQGTRLLKGEKHAKDIIKDIIQQAESIFQ